MIKAKPRNYNIKRQQTMEKTLKQLEVPRFVCLSDSDWASACVCIPKEFSDFRIAGDYCKVNDIPSADDQFPLPRTHDLNNKMRSCKFKSKIDLKKAYYL